MFVSSCAASRMQVNCIQNKEFILARVLSFNQSNQEIAQITWDILHEAKWAKERWYQNSQ